LFERIRQSAWIDAVTIQVVKKRVNSCAQKHLFFEGVPQQKNRAMISPTRYYSHVFKSLWLAAKKIAQRVDF